ncbi:MAG: methionyl-tRNA formyltransferase [Bdellovibrionales bacterium]
MSRFKTVFLGTPDFAVPCLEKLLTDEHFDVVGVVTQPDRPAGRQMKLKASPVKELALRHQIPVLTPEKVKEADALKQIADWQAEVAVVVAYGQILPQSFLDLFPGKAVNVHASLLPRWRGAAPIQRSLMEGDQETGVALQVIVPKLDAGAVIGVRKFALDDKIRADTLYEKLKLLGPELLEVELADYLRGHLAPHDQDESQITIAPKIKKEEGLIDWSKPALQICNEFRGLYLWPGSWTLRDGKILKIKSCRVKKTSSQAKPGQLLEVGKTFFIVACGQNALEIDMVQPESKAAMPVSEYLKGHTLKVGESL